MYRDLKITEMEKCAELRIQNDSMALKVELLFAILNRMWRFIRTLAVFHYVIESLCFTASPFQTISNSVRNFFFEENKKEI